MTYKREKTIIFLILALVVSYAPAQESEVGLDGASLGVISTNPTGNAVSVPTNNILSATFNKALKPSSVNDNSFVVYDKKSGLVIDSEGEAFLYLNDVQGNTQPVHKLELMLTGVHSHAHSGEDWSNAIDNDIEGWDGTVTDRSDSVYAVFKFADGAGKIISKVRIMTDTGVGWVDRWARSFHVEVSRTDSIENFIEVLRAELDDGDWHEFIFESYYARYVKLVIDYPEDDYRQLGEFEVWGTETTLEHPTLLNPQNDELINENTVSLWWRMLKGENIGPLHFIVNLTKIGGSNQQTWVYDSREYPYLFEPSPPYSQSVDSIALNLTSLDLDDGDYSWDVTAVDGNAYGPSSEKWNFTIDTTAPEILSVEPLEAEHEYWFNTSALAEITVRIRYTEKHADKAILTTEGLGGPYQQEDIPSGTNRNVDFILTVGDIADGRYDIEGTIIDKVGHQDQQPSWIGFDGQAPKGSIVSVPPDTTNQESFPVIWSSGDDGTGSGLSGLYSVWKQVDGGDWSLWRDKKPGTSATFHGSNGHHYGFEALSWDNVGNVETRNGVAEDSIVVDITAFDHEPPDSPINLTAGGDSPSPWQTSDTFLIEWQNPDDVSGIDSSFWKLGSPPTSSDDYLQKGPSEGPMPFTLSYGDTATLYGWLVDRKGNSDYNNWASVLLRRDTTPPEVHNMGLTNPQPSFVDEHNRKWYSQTLVPHFNALLTYSEAHPDRAILKRTGIGTPIVKTNLQEGDSVAVDFEVDISAAPDGLYELVGTVVDSAGNSDSTVIALGLDGTAPQIDYIELIDHQSIDSTGRKWYCQDITAAFKARLCYTEMHPAEAKLTRTGLGDSIVVTVLDSGTDKFVDFDVEISGQADGRYELVGSVKDLLGQENSVTRSLGLDSTPPTGAVAMVAEDTSATEEFLVSWSAGDDGQGSGISGSYSVRVQIDGGDWKPWIYKQSRTSAIYHGSDRHQYGFEAAAWDNVCLQENFTGIAEDTVYVDIDNQPPGPPINLTAGGSITMSPWQNSDVFIVEWENPPDPSGIARSFWKRGSPPTSNDDADNTGFADRPLEVRVLNEGSTPLFVWLQDRRGNVDYHKNAKVILRYDAAKPNIVSALPDTEQTYMNPEERRYWYDQNKTPKIVIHATYTEHLPVQAVLRRPNLGEDIVLTDIDAGENVNVDFPMKVKSAADGKYDLTVSISDSAGGIDTTNVFLGLDSTAPKDAKASGPPISASTTFTVWWSPGDDQDGSGLSGEYDVYYRKDNGTWQLWGQGHFEGLSATFEGQDRSTYDFEALAYDRLGHREAKNGVAEATIYVDITANDKTAPTAPVGMTANGVSLKSPWTANPNFKIEWELPFDESGIPKSLWKLGTPPTSNIDADSSGPGEGPLLINLQTEGEHWLYVWLVDGKGNVNFHNWTRVQLRYDATKPTISVFTPLEPRYGDNWYNQKFVSLAPVELRYSEISTDSIILACKELSFKLEIDNPQSGHNKTERYKVPIANADDGAYEIFATVVDSAGNSQTSSLKLQLDATPPIETLAASPDTSSKLKFWVTWSGGSDGAGSGLSGKYEIRYRQEDDTWNQWYEKFQGDSALFLGKQGMRYYFEVAAYDNLGNHEELSSVAECSTYVDTTANDQTAPGPPIELEANGDSPSPWQISQDFKVTWKASDDPSGIGDCFYKLGDRPSDNSDYEGTDSGYGPLSIKATTEGGQWLYVWLSDGHGNADFANASRVRLRYDITEPVINQLIFDEPGYGDNWFNQSKVDEITLCVHYGEMYTDSLIAWSDELGYMQVIDDPPHGGNVSALCSIPLSGQSDGSYAVFASVIDSAGNRSTRSIILNLDATPPILDSLVLVDPVHSESGKKWYNPKTDNGATFEIYYSEKHPDTLVFNAEGMEQSHIIDVTDSGQNRKLQFEVNFDGVPDSTYVLRVSLSDSAKNITSDSLYLGIDGTPPQGTIAHSPEKSGTTSFLVTWDGSATDGTGSGLSGRYEVWKKIDDGDWEPWLPPRYLGNEADFTGEHGHVYAFEAAAWDNVGNREPLIGEAECVTKVDTSFADAQAPAPPIDLTVDGENPSRWQNEPIFEVNWTNPVDPSGIARSFYKLGSAPTSPDDITASASGSPPINIKVNEEGQQLLYLWLSDGQGNANYRTAATLVLRYDNTPPSIDSSYVTNAQFNHRWINPDSSQKAVIRIFYGEEHPDSVHVDAGVVGGPIVINDLQGGYDQFIDFELEIAGLGDGCYKLVPTLVDSAGNSVADSVTVCIDGTPPSGAVATSPPASLQEVFTVSWVQENAGTDDDGSGLSGLYDVRLRIGEGEWQNWWTKYTGNSVNYVGEHGRIYSFEVAAWDNVNNREPFLGQSETSTRVDTTFTDVVAPTAPVELEAEDTNPSPWRNEPRFEVMWQNPIDPSGIRAALYKLDSAPKSDDDTTGTAPGSGPIIVDVTKEDGQPLFVWLMDGKGNSDYTSADSILLRYDITVPTIDTVMALDAGFEGNWYNQNKRTKVPIRVLYSENHPSSVQANVETLSPPEPVTGLTGGDSLWADVELQIGAAEDGAYTVYCVLADSAGNVSEQDSVTIHLDGSPPLISHRAKGGAVPEDQPLEIVATITDNYRIVNATLYYRLGGARLDEEIEMLLQSDSTYSATIDGEFLTSRGLEYSIEASDGIVTTHNPAQNAPVPQHIQRVRIQGADGQGLRRKDPQPHGNAQHAYRLLSIPVEPEDPRAVTVLEDDFGPYDRKKWRFFQYVTQSGQYEEYPNTAGFTPWRAFWLITSVPNVRIDTGPAISVSTGSNVTILLRQGWNDIGCPFDFDIEWSDIIKATGDTLGLEGPYAYEDRWLLPGEIITIKPWLGYTFYAHNDDKSLVIPPKEARTGFLAKTDLPLLSDVIWAIRLTVRCEDASDVSNYLGYMEYATNERDIFDYLEPPPVGSYVSLYFPHDDWEPFTRKYTTDFRPNSNHGDTWEFEIASNIENATAQLIIKPTESFPTNYELRLVDLEADIVAELRHDSTYAFWFANDESVRRFKLIVGDTEYLKDTEKELAHPFAVSQLLQNYPNPFNDLTVIGYELSQASHIELSVYNLLAQKVRTLTVGHLEKGFHQARWDGRDDNGRELGTGIYVLRLDTESFSANRKMIYIR